jgi:hypothetical protein
MREKQVLHKTYSDRERCSQNTKLALPDSKQQAREGVVFKNNDDKLGKQIPISREKRMQVSDCSKGSRPDSNAQIEKEH